MKDAGSAGVQNKLTKNPQSVALLLYEIAGALKEEAQKFPLDPSRPAEEVARLIIGNLRATAIALVNLAATLEDHNKPLPVQSLLVQ